MIVWVFSIACLVLAVVLRWRKFGKKSLQKGRRHTPLGDWPCVVSLLNEESSAVGLRLNTVTTLTQYRTDDFDGLRTYLQKRLEAIVKLNPWIEGRLVRLPNGHVALCYRHFSGELQPETFAVIDADEEAVDVRTMSQDELFRRWQSHIVVNGLAAIEDQSSLCHIRLIRQRSTVLLLVSISHQIADGNTYYALYRMLSSTVTPYGLTVQRVQDFTTRVQTMRQDPNGTHGMTHWSRYPFVVLNILWTIMVCRRPNIHVVSVQPEWISKRKQAYQSYRLSQTTSQGSLPSFISTNDILSSWFLSTCQSKIGIIAIDCRSRIPGLTPNLAGNYESTLTLLSNDFSEPQHIRQSLSLLRRAHEKPELPRGLGLFMSKMGLITSWVTFYDQIELPHATHVYHTPVYEANYVKCHDLCVLFCPRKDEIAMMIISRSLPSGPIRLE